jgi:hydrogenase/urease accessory protein HupE
VNAARFLALLGALLLLGLTLPAAAHEVRPAFLEITERADGKVDVLWKQPSIGLLAVALKPQIAGRLLNRAPDGIAAAENWEIHQWHGLDLKKQGLDGREVRIAGLERTITDTLVIVHLKSGDDSQQVLTPSAPSFTINTHAGAAVSAYLFLGVNHILTGIDHLLFVFGLLLLSSGYKQLLRTVTAFTGAHSITLALTALKLITVKPALIEAMVAYSIVFLAVELVRKQQGKDGLTLRQPWLVAFGFGLLHGAAFAGALKEIGLPAHAIPQSLFLFNLGVEIGQLIFVTLAIAVIWLLKRFRWPSAAPRIAWTVASYGIGSFAMVWFLERLHTALDIV